MNKIYDKIMKFGVNFIVEHRTPMINSLVSINCIDCKNKYVVTIGAVYRQISRKHRHYRCKSCAGKFAWTTNKKACASLTTKKKWRDYKYAGTIIGKAMAREVIKRTT